MALQNVLQFALFWYVGGYLVLSWTNIRIFPRLNGIRALLLDLTAWPCAPFLLFLRGARLSGH